MRRGSLFQRAALLLAVVLLLFVPSVASASSALEFVRIARAHEASNEEDLALRRYTDALGLDPTCEEAYVGLGRLRARRGDLREAERVYNVALEHVPNLRAARVGRAYVRRALGARAEAVEDLLAGGQGDEAVLRVLAGWYADDGQTPAQLAVWRKLVAHAAATGNAALLHEARVMVRALAIMVGPADPAAHPADDGNPVRRLVAIVARRAD